MVKAAAQKRLPGYDKKGDSHYDVVSAFIKSLRGSDATAATYYLARMIDAGEDPKFIARRDGDFCVGRYRSGGQWCAELGNCDV